MGDPGCSGEGGGEKEEDQQEEEAIPQRGQEHVVKPNCGKKKESAGVITNRTKKSRTKAKNGEELENKEAIPKRANRRRTSARLPTSAKKGMERKRSPP